MKPMFVLIFMTLIAVLTIGCRDNSANLPSYGPGTNSVAELDLDALSEALADEEIQDLTSEDIAGLLYMREEEKLARDVYLTFEALYDVNIFANISISEQTHTDAVLLLLDRYSLEDPVGDSVIGVFKDEILQSLYDDLIAQGSESLEAALLVGCAIEEIDILDLVEYMSGTEYADLLLVYGKLLDGSGNHIRAFVRLWEQEAGQEYVPRYMTVEDYELIINDTSGAQQGGRGNGRGGRRR